MVQYNVKLKNKFEKGFFAGSFDPFTNGHLDIVRRASGDFGGVVVGIGENPEKLRSFDRRKMRNAILQSAKESAIESVECVIYPGYTGAVAIEMGCDALIRGVRSDAERAYEENLADWNRAHFGLDTIYYYAPEHLVKLSSTVVRNNLKNRQPIDKLVPSAVSEIVTEEWVRNFYPVGL